MAASPYILRIIFAGAGGLFTALSLLWLMQLMIIDDNDQMGAKTKRLAMEFVRLKRSSETQLKQREKPVEPPPPETQPPQIPELKLALTKPTIMAPSIVLSLPDLVMSDMAFDGPYIGKVHQGPPDRDFMVLSRIPPHYPVRAQRRGIEGWVKVAFIITEQGSVKDAVVVEAKPKRIFDRAALRAILRWKFKPRIIDGKPIAVQANQVIEFLLDKKS